MDANLEILEKIADTSDVPYYVVYGKDGQIRAQLKGKQTVGVFINFLTQGGAR